MNKINPLFVFLIFLVIVLLACNGNEQDAAGEEKEYSAFGKLWRSVAGNFSTEDSFYLNSNSIDSFLTRYEHFKEFKADLKKFYTERDSAYAWYDKRGLIEQAGNLRARLGEISGELPGDTMYYKERLDELLNRPNREKNREELELMLSSQYFFLAHKIWQGMDDKNLQKQGWFIPREKVTSTVYLDSLLKLPEKEFLEEEPFNPQFFRLKEKIAEFREIVINHSGLPEIVAARTLKPGDTGQVIANIRNKLAILGDLKKNNESKEFDQPLLEAINRFQQRHGLKIEPFIDKQCMAALNIPLMKRMEQLLVNLERVRWLPSEFSDSGEYIIVNIPEFMVHVYQNNKPVWNSRVVVGEDLHRTVIFKGYLHHIVFSPHWNIPESIVVNEILPAIEKDKDYIEKQGLEIVSEEGGIPVIRQKPGLENSLGLVKFMFPNNYNIYLHDSPAKHLYDREVRTFSHGCIRVEKAGGLAKLLLKDNQKWSEAAIEEAMHSGNEKYVNLPEKIPVYILYFTAWVNNEGNIQFREDIYNYDARLASGLFKETGGLTYNQIAEDSEE